MKKHYHSVFFDEQKLLKAVLEIHIKKDTFDCDPMYYKGGFYKTIPKPKIISDIRGDELGVNKIDFLNDNSIPDESLESIILDPPFVIANRKSQLKSNTINFGYYLSVDDLIDNYGEMLRKSYKLLKNKGICIFKCQDYTDSVTIMTHVTVAVLACRLGYYVKDLAILVNKKNKISNNKLTQRHFRKIHTYF